MSVERMVQKEIQTMKRIGRNIKHKKGIRGYVGSMYDANRGKSEKQLKKMYDGEMVVYNMEQVLSYKEFKELSEDLQKLHLRAWRTRYSNKDIAKGMGISLSLVVKAIRDLGLSGERKPRIKSVKENVTLNQEDVVQEEAIPTAPIIEEISEEIAPVELAPVYELKKLTFVMTLDRTISGDKLAVQLRAIADFIEREENCIVDMTIRCE